MSTDYGYDLWWLVILNSAVFIIFAFSFVRPRTKLDWRALGGFSAFIVALFTEMYGFPLTIYLLSGWLGNRIPGLDLLSHNTGHLWQDLTGWQGDPHLSPLHLLSNVLIAAGFILLYRSWQVLSAAQREHRLAVSGPYARVRHPQYIGFLLIMTGFLLQWPTLLTLLMFPVLVIVYLRLARKEERMMDAEFGDAYAAYRRQVPGFIPRFGRGRAGTGQRLQEGP
ncbi:isoprenylcysteine carboxylmethyltransferase family protein [Pseudarthrobacter sp. RMG13]|uniref:Isoprenylcysteine carboxylmethyltransferase family protein n=1 Tax=Pseudarthrobacter humi TaxID=2952523 RepID=A0ABT1LLW9_9MICC|nr:isoprenylcysteine carboxylmethyltransferase family protein [Pseudarthrobacter humi]MCP8999425.1 isoprenylcysteine carboxylmethyltransferase family protein [Pseudarthrobacter humi]